MDGTDRPWRYGQKADRIAAPAARRVRMVQVRSGHFGSRSRSGASSDIGNPRPVWHLPHRYDRRGRSDEGAAGPQGGVCEVRMPLNFSNARMSCTHDAGRRHLRAVTIFKDQPPMQPQGDGLHSSLLGYCGWHFAGTRTEPQLARDLVKLPRTYRLCCPRLWGQHFCLRPSSRSRQRAAPPQ
jgi:hypothetical protein